MRHGSWHGSILCIIPKNNLEVSVELFIIVKVELITFLYNQLVFLKLEFKSRDLFVYQEQVLLVLGLSELVFIKVTSQYS